VHALYAGEFLHFADNPLGGTEVDGEELYQIFKDQLMKRFDITGKTGRYEKMILNPFHSGQSHRIAAQARHWIRGAPAWQTRRGLSSRPFCAPTTPDSRTAACHSATVVTRRILAWESVDCSHGTR
jgi:hypothetical protein